MMPTPIAVSSSFAFIIGERAAMAAAPQMPVPRLNNKERLKFSVQIGNTRDIANAITSHEIDVGIVEGEIPHRNLYIKSVSTDQMYIVAGGKYPIYFNKEVTRGQIEKENWIVRKEGSGTRDATEKLFETLEIRPTRLMEFGSTQLIKEAVEAGLGISYLSELTVKKERMLGTIQVLNVKGKPIKRNFSVITESVELHTKSMNLFIELIEKYVENQLLQ
ncbi:LysR substrate-binding domain-containing protein [Bacillus sp. X1(2014)]|uniref:LysR substrate-binding domain-containing protein n=1 Tax=Bacillus sp. X1(2014) TaxID=1565991 RepID=UPI0028CBA14E|nr:LysR substrate-binding domain-containing protein [Bacillus sp. X1(2014)]